MKNKKVWALLYHNNEEIRDKLTKLGHKLCICASFKDNIWLSWHPSSDIIHGIGNRCEHECSGYNTEKCLICSIKGAIELNYELHLFNDVESFDKFIKEYNYED